MVELKYDRKLKLTKITKLGVDESTATNLFYALITLVLGQGIADINKKK